MSDIAEKDRVTAHHEAGHAVAAHLLGVPIRATVLKADGLQGGVRSKMTFKEMREANLVLEHAVVLAIGPSTEELFFGRIEWDFCRDDVEKIKGLYEHFLKPSMTEARYRAEVERRKNEVLAHPVFREAVGAIAKHLTRHRVACSGRVARVLDDLGVRGGHGPRWLAPVQSHAMTEPLNVYSFRVTLAGITEFTPVHDDALYKAGCDDAGIRSCDGVVTLHFDRESALLGDAIGSAVNDVMRAGLAVARVDVESFAD
jgi:hypothetical protein